MDNKYLISLAEHALKALDAICDKAKDKYEKGIAINPNNALANPSDFNAPLAQNNLVQISQTVLVSLKKLINEPAICRVSTIDENGEPRVFMICRETAAVEGIQPPLASYHAPIGRLAALPIGEDLPFKDGRYYEVTEKIFFKVSNYYDKRDSVDNVVESNEFKTKTIKSLRALVSIPDKITYCGVCFFVL